MRPVGLSPLSVRAEVLRPGRKVQLVESMVTQGDTLVSRGRALQVRVADVDLTATNGSVPTVKPASSVRSRFMDSYPAFHNEGADVRFASGSLDQPGPATVWVRLRYPVVAGESPSPLQRVVAASDFGNGVAAALSFDEWMFLNPDLTVYLYRYPAGDWVCLDATTYLGSSGRALAASSLYDQDGMIGSAQQSLLVEPRSSDREA